MKKLCSLLIVYGFVWMVAEVADGVEYLRTGHTELS